MLGLDGATFDVLDPLFARGELPHLAHLAGAGWRTELWSTLPPATLPAWTSFLTAASPASHGVTDLMLRVPRTYGLRPASGHDRRLPTFLMRLSAAGLRVASVGVPGTYPPEPIRGLCIPGFDAPGAARVRADGVWPPELYPRLMELGGWTYAAFNEHGPARTRLQQAVPAILADLEVKERVIASLYSEEPWDLFFVHLQASDTAQHHLWHTHDPLSPRAAHPELSDALTRVLRRIDALVGRLLARVPPAGRVLVVSDHGMGGASDVAVHLNRWLSERDFLVFADGLTSGFHQIAGRVARRALSVAPKRLLGAAVQRLPVDLAARLFSLSHQAPINFAATLAFSDELDYAPSIWLNRRRSFPNGRVSEAEAPAMIERLVADLAELRHPTTGETLVARVYRRQDLPQGPHVSLSPDLLIDPAWPQGYRASFLPSRSPGPAVRRMTPEERDASKGAGMAGVHKRQGVFMAFGPGLRPLDLPLMDLPQAGALVYPLLGVPVPSDVAAQLPTYADELLAVQRSSGDATDAPASPASIRDQVEMLRQLNEMGYLG